MIPLCLTHPLQLFIFHVTCIVHSFAFLWASRHIFYVLHTHTHTQPRLQNVPGNVSLDVKRLGPEVYHSPPATLPSAYAIPPCTWTTYHVKL
jgi:hypothetical protein